MRGPKQSYQERVARGELECDPAQDFAVERLQRLHDALKGYSPGKRGWLSRPRPAPKGLYIFGGVGRGKSLLMDLFFETAPVRAKRRVHFHAFMQEVHAAIAEWRALTPKERRKRPEWRKDAGDDPIRPVAQGVALEAHLLCFDEFQVTDIADAMILGRLFEAFLEFGVVIVSTSNRAPSDLYKNGLNRQLFLPFIDLICDRFEVFELESEKDYRLDRLRGAPVYFSPLGTEADAAMDAAWERLTGGAEPHSETLPVLGRELKAPCTAHGAARFGFADLAERELGPADFLALGRRFHTLFIDHIKVMSPADRNAAKRFVTLIDTLYEHKVKLVASAEAAPEGLYPKGDGAFEFERTTSRLIEMQSEDYLALPHATQ